MSRGARRHTPGRKVHLRRATAASLRDAQARLGAVLAAVPDLWFVMDAQGHYLEVSDPHHPAMSGPWEEAQGRPFGEVVSPELSALVDGTLKRALATGRVQSLEYELEIRGQARYFEARLAPMPTGHWLYLTRDLTERRRDEKALSRHRDELEHLVAERTSELIVARDAAERASQAKSEFLSSMSHELRTPLNAVLGFAQLLEQDAGIAPRAAEQIQHILRGGRHLLRLINDVLDLSQIESGHLALALENLRLDALLAEVLTLMQPLATQRALVLTTGPLGGVGVRADRLRLQQVLLNLVSNALKYNRRGGRVEVRVEHIDDARVRVVVEDTGPGIAPADLDRLFEPFDRLGAEGGPIEGNGIGLSISLRLIEAMGGQIRVHSELGVGSSFCVELPAADPAADRVPSPASAAALTVSLPPACVLCVEDNPINLVLMQHLFGRYPQVDLVVATTAKQGLALAREHRPALMLLDVHLPDQDGYQMLAALRADPATRGLTAVAVTANAMPGDQRRAAEAGFAAYLSKPIDVARFDALMPQLLAAAAERERIG